MYMGRCININSSDITDLSEKYNKLTNEITGYINIDKNKYLKIIDNFNNLTEIGTYITIDKNQELTHITGFYNLTEIGEHIFIIDNHKLKYISEFPNLKKIGTILNIRNNNSIQKITGFNNLTEINEVFHIEKNLNLTYIIGFNNLNKIGIRLNLWDNPKLITMSIPYTLFKSPDMVSIEINNNKYLFKSPKQIINHPDIIKCCIDKFDPGVHPDIVVKQIIENLELWGEPDTNKTIINHILSKGNYLELIPESMIQYVEERYHHLYNAKHANTGARNIAKMTTGRYLGTF